jgi:hypothetical protein
MSMKNNGEHRGVPVLLDITFRFDALPACPCPPEYAEKQGVNVLA